MREMRTGRHLAIFLVVLAVVGAACNDDDNADSATTPASTTSTSTTVAVTTTVEGPAAAGVTSRQWARAWTRRATKACGGRRCASFRAMRPRRPVETAAASNFRVRYHPRRDRNGRGWRVIVRFARQVEGCTIPAEPPARARRVGC
jgi:hypothetical protein